LQEKFIVTCFANPADRPALTVMAPTVSAGVPRERRPGLLARVLDRMARWQERVRQRQALMRLAPHLMKDIGISETDIWLGSKKPFLRD
jgi:uncharacterized protein YjiS (DUF1127 family)